MGSNSRTEIDDDDDDEKTTHSEENQRPLNMRTIP